FLRLPDDVEKEIRDEFTRPLQVELDLLSGIEHEVLLQARSAVQIQRRDVGVPGVAGKEDEAAEKQKDRGRLRRRSDVFLRNEKEQEREQEVALLGETL